MSDYSVDGSPLSVEEVHLHRGSRNATLNALYITGLNAGDGSESISEKDAIARESFDQADAMVREYRDRIMRAHQNLKQVRLYRRFGNIEAVTEWIEQEGKRKPPMALVLMKLQHEDNLDRTFTDGEIRTMCGVSDKTLDALVEAGMLEVVGDDEA